MRITFPRAKSQAAYSIHRRDSNRNKPPAIKEGAAVLALAHSDIKLYKYKYIQLYLLCSEQIPKPDNDESSSQVSTTRRSMQAFYNIRFYPTSSVT